MITVSLLVEFQELWTLMTATAPESPGRRSWLNSLVVGSSKGPARTATELHLTILAILSITIQSLMYPGLVLKNELSSDHLFRTQLPNKQTKRRRPVMPGFNSIRVHRAFKIPREDGTYQPATYYTDPAH
jgi:hypothetical protein